MVVTWATQGMPGVEPSVRYAAVGGPGAGAGGGVATGNTTVFDDPAANANGTQFVHRVVLSGLALGTTYEYACDCGGPLSAQHNFTTMHGADGLAGWPAPPRFLVYGDMGKDGGAPSLQRIIDEVTEPTGDPVTAILHLGDFACE